MPNLLNYAAKRPIARWRTQIALALALVGGLLAGYARKVGRNPRLWQE